MKKKVIGLVFVAVIALVVAGGALAAANAAGFEIPRHVIGSGGGKVSQGSFTLNATIGQPIVGVDSNADYTLCSGYWCTSVTYEIYLPLALRG